MQTWRYLLAPSQFCAGGGGVPVPVPVPVPDGEGFVPAGGGGVLEFPCSSSAKQPVAFSVSTTAAGFIHHDTQWKVGTFH